MSVRLFVLLVINTINVKKRLISCIVQLNFDFIKIIRLFLRYFLPFYSQPQLTSMWYEYHYDFLTFNMHAVKALINKIQHAFLCTCTGGRLYVG